MSSSSKKLEFFKNSFSQFHGLTHLNNAGLAPISSQARDKIMMWAKRFYEEGFFTDADYMEDVKSARINLSKLIECDWSDIAFFQSTAGGINQVAQGFGLSEGDEVVIWDQEYSSNLYPWRTACQKSGAKLIFAKSGSQLQTPLESIVACITKNTKIVAVSWVQFQTGAVTDIKKLGEFCRARNIFTCVDIMQGLGVHEFKMTNWQVDAACGGSHKWLVSPVGVGFLALDKKWHSIISPLNVGSSTYGSCDDPANLVCEPKVDALKYEAGSKQVLEITALGASCELILDTGIALIEQEALSLARLLKAGLKDLGCKIHSIGEENGVGGCIVNFTMPEGVSLDTGALLLTHANVNFAKRGPGIRLSPHAFNSKADIIRALGAIESSVKC